MERKKRTPWWQRIHDAIVYLHQHHLFIEDNLYSFSGRAMSHPLVRRRLIDDNAVFPLGRCCEGGNSQHRANLDLLEKVEEAAEKLRSKGRPIDPHLHRRTLYILNPERLDEINRQLLLQKPHFSAKMNRAHQLTLDFSENDQAEQTFNWSDH